MNYFERLWRRARFDALGETTADVDDPFAWVAPWPLEDVRPHQALIAPQGAPVLSPAAVARPGLDGSNSETIQSIMIPAQLVPGADAAPGPTHSLPPDVASAPAPGLPEIATRPSVPVSPEPLRPTPHGTIEPLAQADAFMLQLARGVADSQRSATPPQVHAPSRLAPSMPEVASPVNPTRATALAPIREAHPVVTGRTAGSSQLSIGSIDVEVRAPQSALPAAPRVVVVRATSPSEGSRASRGPTSQRFGIGQT